MELHPIDLLRREAPRWLGAISGRLDPVLAPIRRAPRRNLTLGGVALLALLAAIGVRCLSHSQEDAPTDEFIGFRCEKCGEYFEISHREFERLFDAGRYSSGESGRTLTIECIKCGEMTAQRAARGGGNEAEPRTE